MNRDRPRAIRAGRLFAAVTLGAVTLAAGVVVSCGDSGRDAAGPAHGLTPETRRIDSWDAFLADVETPPRQVVFIGLDGASWDYMDQLIADGMLPNIARIKREGTYGVLRSVPAYVSPPAWASMMTGYSPKQTGIYTFGTWDSEARDFVTVSSDDVAVPTVWDAVTRAARKVCVSNVPVTYPPHPVNGIMTTGMLTPIETRQPLACRPTRGDYEKLFVKPRQIKQSLRSMYSVLADEHNLMLIQAHDIVGDPNDEFEKVSVRVLSQPLHEPLGLYVFSNRTNSPWMDVMTDEGPAYSKIYLDVSEKDYRVRLSPTVLPIEAEYTYPAELRTVLDAEFGFFLPSKFMTKNVMESLAEDATRHAKFLFDHDDWDFYAFVFTQTDQMHHQVGFDETAAEVYQAIDEFIGNMMARLPSGSTLVLASDHGFAEYDRGVDLNLFLSKLGLLEYAPGGHGNIDYDRTLVFHNLWHLYVNHDLVTRETLRAHDIDVPAGADPTRALLDFVARAAAAFEPSGGGGAMPLSIEPIAPADPAVVSNVADAPDAVVKGTYDGYFVEFWNLAKPKQSIVSRLEGSERFNHTREGFFAMWGDGVAAGVNVGIRDIQDITPTMLYAMGLPVSADMDGEVIAGGFTAEQIGARPLYVNSGYRDIPREPVPASKERDTLEKRLKSLGYIR